MASNDFNSARYQSNLSKANIVLISGSSRNAPYQIDFQVRNRGKRVAATKRCVKFRFGFPNSEALARGAGGVECRGCEHEVALVWSVTSGKRLVLVDGVDVHFSVGRNKSRIECSWTMSGRHVFKLVAHAALPLRPTPGFRQFDLLLDGRSFFDFPRIFEVGSGTAPRLAPSTLEPPSYGHDKRWDASARDDDVTTRSYSATGVDDPSDAMSDQQSHLTDPLPIPDLLSDPLPMNQAQDRVSTSVPFDDFGQMLSGCAPMPPAPSVDLTAPLHHQPNSSAQSNDVPRGFGGILTPAGPSATYSGAIVPNNKSYEPIAKSAPSNEVLQNSSTQDIVSNPVAFGQVPSTVAPVIPQTVQCITPPTYVVPVASSNDSVAGSLWTNSDAGSHSVEIGSHSYGDEAATSPNGQPWNNFHQSRDESPRTVGDIDQALQGLVNLEDIRAPVEDQTSHHKLTITQPTAPSDKMNPFSSQPLPPTTPTWGMGSGASLGQLKGINDQSSASKPRVQVMNSISEASGGGALVMYGNNGMGGPPPLQHMRGFGAGASMENGGYTQTRQDLPLPYASQPW